ncbi:MAG: hypothetical protein HN350_20255 [Phycisphaerales bacterium]|jgi:hypothetical protein|nr:hypothetical protein [Phycisphaerales bacterium]
MQASVIYTLPETVSSRRVELSAECSEWLFAIRFWNNLNFKLGTLFDQYEEESVDVEALPCVLSLLRRVIAHLRAGEGSEIEFVRGWDVNGNPLEVRINREALIEELGSLDALIDYAIREAKGMEFEL